ncbi:glycosyltransferase family 2 protein [Flavobacterium sp. LB2P44]|uniref:glycosyltransferase family 2 protein n=1 Tax=Flavobacterium sp. LB2P44 TaxID=3401713 RepID=UPI003AAA2D8D
MEECPKLSVCMITYGHEKFIEKAINSVLMQKCDFSIELIIANDCSPDKTDLVIQNILTNHPKASIIKYIRHHQNIGMVPNCFFVTQEAKGRYIAVCDGDDFWNDPMKLQKQVDFLESNPEYVISCHDTVVVNESGIKIQSSIFNDLQKKDWSEVKLINGAFIMPLTMCYRNLIKELPPEIYKVDNFDVFLISLLGHFGKSKFQQEIEPASYRQHSGGISSMISDLKKDFQHKNTFWQIFKYYYRNNSTEYAVNYYTKYRQMMFRLIKSRISDFLYIDSVKLYTEFILNTIKYGFWKESIYLTVDILKFVKNK